MEIVRVCVCVRARARARVCARQVDQASAQKLDEKVLFCGDAFLEFEYLAPTHHPSSPAITLHITRMNLNGIGAGVIACLTIARAFRTVLFFAAPTSGNGLCSNLRVSRSTRDGVPLQPSRLTTATQCGGGSCSS